MSTNKFDFKHIPLDNMSKEEIIDFIHKYPESHTYVELKFLSNLLNAKLNEWKDHFYKDLKEVSPGIHIHKDVNNFYDSLDWLHSILPKS